MAVPKPHDAAIARMETRGERMPDTVRTKMEGAFGRDFSDVRIHRDSAAADTAGALGARAFAVGKHIAFNRGEFAPGTLSGDRLIAHELAHYVSENGSVPSVPFSSEAGRHNAAHSAGTKSDLMAQEGGVRRSVLRRQLAATEAEAEGTPEDDNIAEVRFAVQIDRVMTEQEFLAEILRQYFRISLEDATERAEGWRFARTPRPVTQADIGGYRFVLVEDRTATLHRATDEEQRQRTEEFRRFSGSVQGAINSETDRRFWVGTNYKPGQQLGRSAQDRSMYATWLQYRDQVTGEHLAIAAIPTDVREAIFSEYAVREVSPQDYPQLLRIAEKLQGLTPLQIRAYGNRVTETTQSLDVLERSIDQYLAQLERQRLDDLTYRETETKLYGFSDAYQLYRDIESLETSLRLIPSHDEFGVEDPTHAAIFADIEAKRRQLERAIAPEFASVADFETALEDYVERFATQARNTAFDMLLQLEHQLFSEQQRYENTNAAEALHQRLQASRATEEYDRAWALRRRASGIGARANRSNWREILAQQRPLLSEARAAEQLSNSEYDAATEPDPLAGQLEYRDRVRLMKASDAATVREVLLDFIAEKREAIGDTRRNLAEESDLVFELDEVLSATYERLGIEPGSLYDRVIRNHINDVSIAEAIWGVAKGLFALALAIVGGIVGGPVGAGLALAGFGLGVSEAVTAFNAWETASDAHEAGLLSEDPSFGWVILAVVGAGLDLGGAVAAVRAMRPAVDAFNATGDLAALNRALSRLDSIDARVQANVMRAARLEARMQETGRQLLAIGGRLNSAIAASAEGFARLVQLAHYGARRGIVRFHDFLLELQRRSLIDEIESLSANLRNQLKEAHAEGLRRASETGTYSTRVEWGIHRLDARPEGAGYWGRRIPQSNPRVDAYELKINPSNESFYLPHPNGGFVQFEDLAVDVLQDGKLVMAQRSIYHVDDMPSFARAQVLTEARRQVAAAEQAGLKVEWLISERRAMDQLNALFQTESIDITCRYFPE